MVVTANAHASTAALTVLRDGGSAADAAIAAALVLNVVEPQSSGIGGGGFLLHYDSRSGHVSTWDGRETAPAAVDERLFLKADGTPMDFYSAAIGARAAGVPGMPALLAAVHERHGRLPWARLFEPAIHLAEEGFAVSPRLAALIARDRFLGQDAQARELFFDADGEPLAAGAWLRNPALAATLRTLAEQGAAAFYRGELAADIAVSVRAEPSPGRLAVQDLAAYRVVERPPLCGAYRGWRICGMPPPSAGGASMLALLGMLERFPLGELAVDSAFSLHLFAEAGRLAQADREAWYGDPQSMPIPPERLLAPAYLAARSALIEPGTSMRRAEPGQPSALPAVPSTSPERPATTHISIIDADGNAVALTASIENAFGSRRMVRGFLLNNQLTDFSFRPDGAAGAPEGHPNRVGGGKRPRSAMTPTLVFSPDGRLYAVLGSSGGGAIVDYVAAALVRLIDWRMRPEVLLARTHVSSRNDMLAVEATPAGERLAQGLALFGHEAVLRDFTSGTALIVRAGEGGWVGAADPRREGEAAGY